MKIALIQQHAAPDKKDNIQRAVAAYETAARQGAQLIAFAELAFTVFYPQNPAGDNNLEIAEPIPGPTTERFMELAQKYQVVTVLNLFEKDGGSTYDSSPVIDADGTLLGVTRMVHIMEGPCYHELGYYTPGDGQSLVFDTAVGKIGVAICYDRHYPEYMRALALQGAELVIVPQAGSVGEWPAGVYEAELQIAGFHNGYFIALCNRVGKEEKLTFEGKSFVTAPDGQIIAQAPALRDDVLITDIDLNEVKNCSARRHFIPDRRPELYPAWLSNKI
ncbi:nitrilase-related carbon-nitrogen hydrolase [Planctomycetota bacterium]